MAVLLETTVGDIVIDLYPEERPRCCLNFLKLCKMKYFNFNIFHSVQSNFMAQTGDPTGTGSGGESVFCKLQGEEARFFDMELHPRIKHKKKGCVSMVNNGTNQHGSQFFFTLREDIDYLDGIHTVFGEVTEGFDVLDKISETFCDGNHRPLQDIRINHTVILDDPFDDPMGLEFPDKSPEIDPYEIKSDRIPADEDIEKERNKTVEEVKEETEEQETRAKAQILEMIGDLPDADVKPPEDVLFVCKLNPVTTSEDLEIIFSRFGKLTSCDVIKDQATGDSLCYAFVEFEKEEDCEEAYFKMDNVLIDDRRIHVDFSQSVAKLQFKGKGPVMPQRPNAANRPRGQRSGDGSYRGAPVNRRDPRSSQERLPRKKDLSRAAGGDSESLSPDRSASHKRRKETATRQDDRKYKKRESRSLSPSPDRPSYRSRSGDRSHDRKTESWKGMWGSDKSCSPSPDISSNKKRKGLEQSGGRSRDREDKANRGRSSSGSHTPIPDRSSRKKREGTDRLGGRSHDIDGKKKKRRGEDRESSISHSPDSDRSSGKKGKSGGGPDDRKSEKKISTRNSSGSVSPSPDRSSSKRKQKPKGEKKRRHRSDSQSYSAVDESSSSREKRAGERSHDRKNGRSRDSSSDLVSSNGPSWNERRTGDRSGDRREKDGRKKSSRKCKESSDDGRSEDEQRKRSVAGSDVNDKKGRRSSREKTSSSKGRDGGDRGGKQRRRHSSGSSTESSSSGDDERSGEQSKVRDRRKTTSRKANTPESSHRRKKRR